MSQNIQELREAICDVGRKMYDRNLCSTNDGNISIRLDDGNFLITPTGVSKGFMTPDMMCIVDKDGNLVEENGPWKGTSEFKLHYRIYQLRPDVNAVVHAHPLYGTVFASANIPLDKPICTEAALNLGEIPVIKYGLPGTFEICGDIEDYIEYHDAVLMRYHGAVTYGPDVLTAYYRMESLEFIAQQTFAAKAMGIMEQATIPEDVMDGIFELRREKYSAPDSMGPHHIANKK